MRGGKEQLFKELFKRSNRKGPPEERFFSFYLWLLGHQKTVNEGYCI
jgi:hypothetical protein